MTRKKILVSFIIIHLVAFMEVLCYFTLSPRIIESNTIEHVLLIIFSPLAIYGHVLGYKEINSRKKFTTNAWLFLFLNISWLCVFSYILFITWGFSLIIEKEFLFYADMISAFRIFIYSTFIPVFFPERTSQ